MYVCTFETERDNNNNSNATFPSATMAHYVIHIKRTVISAGRVCVCAIITLFFFYFFLFLTAGWTRRHSLWLQDTPQLFSEKSPNNAFAYNTVYIIYNMHVSISDRWYGTGQVPASGSWYLRLRVRQLDGARLRSQELLGICPDWQVCLQARQQDTVPLHRAWLQAKAHR